MKALSEATFKQLAGDQAFTRGLKLYNQGRVGELSQTNNEVTTTVHGSTDYQVILHHTAKQFEGSCECPASDRFDFCKHCVAASLAYYYQTQANQEIADEASDDKIAIFLNTLTKPDLIKELNSLIQQDPTIKDHWTLKAELAGGGLSPAEVRKRITKALPYKANGIWRFKDVAEYFTQAHADLSIISDAIINQAPRSAFKLVVYATQRLEKALRNIDDSNAYRSKTESLLVALFTRVISIQHWSLKQKVSELTDLILDPDFDYDILNIPYAQLEVIGKSGFADICTTVDKAWQLLELPEERYGKDYFYYSRLENMLVEQAQDNNDQERELEILERGALHVERCLELVYQCIDYNRYERAEKWLRFSEQLKRLSVHELYDVESAQIALWQATHKTEEATNALWARFEESEARKDFDSLMHAVNKDDVVWLDRAIKLLGGRITPSDKQAKTQQRVETLACIYIDYGYIEEAKQLHTVFSLRSDVLLYLVSKSDIGPSTIHLIEEGINQLLQQAHQNVYHDAVQTLDLHFDRCPTAFLDEYLSMVMRVYDKPENKRKTNFIKLLKNTFKQLFNSPADAKP